MWKVTKKEPPMLILNFAHPITEPQREKIEALTEQKIEEIKSIKVHFEGQRSFIEQVTEIIEEIGLTSDDWQTRQILINPPSLNYIACVLLAELHGRMGYFPPIIRLRQIPEVTPPKFEVAEIINLNAVRNNARQKR
jgi:hypothetical protein